MVDLGLEQFHGFFGVGGETDASADFAKARGALVDCVKDAAVFESESEVDTGYATPYDCDVEGSGLRVVVGGIGVVLGGSAPRWGATLGD